MTTRRPTIHKQKINLLQRQIRRFGVEEVYNLSLSVQPTNRNDNGKGGGGYRNKSQVQAHKNQIPLPGQILD